MRTISNSKKTMDKIIEAMEITEETMKKPLECEKDDDIIGLYNPQSKATCLLLQLYSMEIGSPQLYKEVNRVARDMDKNYLKELGPYLQALGRITEMAEKFNEEE